MNQKVMEALKAVRVALSQFLLKFAEITAEDGTVIYHEDGTELAVGTALFLKDGEEMQPLADGVYAVDGQNVVVAAGVITEITPKEVVPDTAPAEDTAPEPLAMSSEIKPLNVAMAALKAENKEIKTLLKAIALEFAKMAETNGVPATAGGDVDRSPKKTDKKSIWD